jgi:competence protein ComEA
MIWAVLRAGQLSGLPSQSSRHPVQAGAAHQVFWALLAFLAFLAFPHPANGQQLPEGPGKAELLKVCGACHQAERSASVRLTREGWDSVIADMIRRGAKGTDEEYTAILNYLATHFLGEAPRPLNINRATAIDLVSVGGLTRKESAAVLKWLDEVGICKSLDELKKVPGLDYKKIEARKDFVVCFEAPPVKKEK